MNCEMRETSKLCTVGVPPGTWLENTGYIETSQTETVDSCAFIFKSPHQSANSESQN